MPDTVASYPRPDLDRSQRWELLDGQWAFFPDHAGLLSPENVSSTPATEVINVPGNWEEGASGGRHDWLPTAWYRRTVVVPSEWAGDRIWLTVGAVFSTATLWVNGRECGTSTSGYLPWEIDITDAISEGFAELVIRVSSPIDKRDIIHGKQRSVPADDYNFCSFTPSSGIWQSVWIEPRASVHVAAVRLTPSPQLDGIEFDIELRDTCLATAATVIVEPEWDASPERVAIVDGRARGVLSIVEPRLWSPQDPHLYFLRVRVVSELGEDSVRTYTGLRSIETRDGQILLNSEPLYVRGVLDQGYWPVTGLAAPSEEALVRDLELARTAGFNLVRKHLKPESPLWLYHADRLGMLVWAEVACPGRLSAASADAMKSELAAMLKRDASHPSIVIWSAYNEEWGLNWSLDRSDVAREVARDAYRLLKRLDPTRLAVDNSGWNHVESDLLDWHLYDNVRPELFGDVAATVVAGQPWDLWHSTSYPTRALLSVESNAKTRQAPLINSEYGGGWDSVARAWHTRWQTQYLRLLGKNQGYVFTELYDIEAETVGIYSADRRSKDEGGFQQKWVHTDTVIIPLLRPLTYGAELIAAPGESLHIDVKVSHVGNTRLDGELGWHFNGHSGAAEAVSVEPFGLTAVISFTVPVDSPGRLHFQVCVGDDEVAHTFVDIAHEVPASHVPPDSGWRPDHPQFVNPEETR